MTRRRINPEPEYRPINYAPIPGLKIKNRSYDAVAKQYLQAAGELFEVSRNLDTAVGDTVLQGLAYIVHTAYDSQACSVALDSGSFHDFIAKKTAEWFSSRGCADWFCQAAAALFSTERREVFHIQTKKTRRGHKVLTKIKVA